MRQSPLLATAAALITAVTLMPPSATAAPPAFDLAPGMLTAMRRDLGLNDDQIAARWPAAL